MSTQKHHEVIHAFEAVIAEIYNEKKIRSLRGPKLDYILNEKQIFAWFFNVVRKGQIKYKGVNFHASFDDIGFCSDELLYFMAHIYLYEPFMNNPLDDAYCLEGTWIYPNEQNLPAKRFSMYANVLLEKLYNYWDRIGDLIAIYLPETVKGTNIYFSSTIDRIPVRFQSSENYEWLKSFRNTHYAAMNEKRIGVVHYITLDTAFRENHLKNVTDKAEMEKLVSERNQLPEFFREQIELTLTGFEKTVQLIEEINEVDWKDITL
jgi:hypothetical protein